MTQEKNQSNSKPKFDFKSKFFIAIVLVGIVAVVLATKSSTTKSKTPGDKKADAPKPALTVTTAQPSQVNLPVQLRANGNIVAWQEAIIGSESNGLRLSEVRVNVGDKVRAGQVLAVFAAETVQSEVEQANANVMEAQANLADATQNAERARALQGSGALSTQQINQYFTGEQTAKAKLAAAKANLSAQQLRLKQTKLVAPDDGVISSRTATVGAVLGVGTELFRVIRQGRLEWRAEVTSAELGRLAIGTPVVLQAANGARLKGKVRMIAPTVDTQNRVGLVYVDLVSAPATLDEKKGSSTPTPLVAKAGMFATGEFELGNTTALTVAQQSLVVRDGFNYVFRLNPDQRVSQIKVQIGRRFADRVEVLNGISADANLVVNGAGFLNDGDLVKNVVNSNSTHSTAILP